MLNNFDGISSNGECVRLCSRVYGKRRTLILTFSRWCTDAFGLRGIWDGQHIGNMCTLVTLISIPHFYGGSTCHVICVKRLKGQSELFLSASPNGRMENFFYIQKNAPMVTL